MVDGQTLRRNWMYILWIALHVLLYSRYAWTVYIIALQSRGAFSGIGGLFVGEVGDCTGDCIRGDPCFELPGTLSGRGLGEAVSAAPEML